MNKVLKKISLLALAVMALAGTAANAQVSFNNGDLILGFRATGGTGSTTNVMINLGAGTFFRDQNSAFFSVGNFNTDLTNAFGAGWASRSDLLVGIVGNFTNSGFPPSGPGTITNGDGVRTIYASSGTSGFSLGSTGNMGSIAANIQALNGAFDIAAQGATSVSALLPTSTTNTWSDFAPTSFGGLGGTFESGFTSNQAILDLYRYVPRTSASIAENPASALVGVSQGFFTIANNGDITYGAVPEPSTYASLGLGLVFLVMVLRRRQALA